MVTTPTNGDDMQTTTATLTATKTSWGQYDAIDHAGNVVGHIGKTNPGNAAPWVWIFFATRHSAASMGTASDGHDAITQITRLHANDLR